MLFAHVIGTWDAPSFTVSQKVHLIIFHCDESKHGINLQFCVPYCWFRVLETSTQLSLNFSTTYAIRDPLKRNIL